MTHSTSHYPTTNKHLIRWVEKMADLTQPEHIHWVDGSKAEYEKPTLVVFLPITVSALAAPTSSFL